MKTKSNYFVIGYNVIMTFEIGDRPAITEDEEATKQYLKEKLMYMIAHDKYMIELFRERPDESDEYDVMAPIMIRHYKRKIKLYENVIRSHTVTREGDTYTLQTQWLGKMLEDSPKETREYNDGCAIQFICDALRNIGMCDQMMLEVDVNNNTKPAEKRIPKSDEEWAAWDEKESKEARYWLDKVGNFRIVAIPRDNPT